MSGDGAQQPAEVTVLGPATAEETAALVVVLAAVAGEGDGEPASGAGSEWASPARRVRADPGPRPGGWRASALPR